MATLAQDVIVSAERLSIFADAVLRAVGMPDEDAAISARAMVWAELRNLPAHGVTGKLPQAARRIRTGGTKACVSWDPVSESATFTVFDARDAWGQVAAARAMRAAIGKATTQGLSISLVRNSSSAAAMGHYASLAATAGMIGVAITNGPPLMPAPGGTTKVVGNQGFAIGCPAGRHFPLLFDSALSLISTGEIHTAQERDEQLAPGLMLDAQGQPTVDPAAALAGLYVPIGGHRGFGIALMWEVLAGVLSGGPRFAPDVGAPDVYEKSQGVSHFLMAIDPSVSMPLAMFTERVDVLIDQVHASPRAANVDRIYVPGERGHIISQQRERDGIPISAKREAQLRALAQDVGVPW
ncbi:MAG: Ldh family oxidoreductase [Candidatus Limnocylindria bacterium]